MSGHDELHGLAEAYWEGVLEANPTLATLLGDRRFDDRIEDVSAVAEERRRVGWSALLERVEGVDPGELAAEDQVTRNLLRAELRDQIDRLARRQVELASDQMDGVHVGLLQGAEQLSAPTPETAEDLIVRFRQVGTLLDKAGKRFLAGLAAGRTPARIVIERSLSQLDGFLASDPAEDPFTTIEGPDAWDGEAAWRDDLARVDREVIRPGLQRYRDLLADELLPVGRPDTRPGLSWLGDDGAALYASLVREHTTLDDLGPEEIHRIGLAEIERLTEEYAAIGEEAFGTRDRAEVFARLQGDPALRYDDADQIMDHVRRCVDRAWSRLGDWFGRLPEAPCDILPVPDYLAKDSSAAYYSEPAADGSRPGAYFVNLYEPHEQNRYETAATAYHEAVPGHHLQVTIATELTQLPRFQRFTQGNTAFAEGWALYTERLADEMDLYETAIDRLGLLAGDSWRSGRLVVDTGLHALGWTRQQAIDFLVAHVPASRSHIETEVDRYIAIPGQALGYKVGQLEIQRLRAAAEADARFDIKGFHDVVLGSGTVSLPVLRDLVTAWAA